jgi:hypothetical protein
MVMTDKQKANIQENIVKLYLRLNGYLSTSLIIHSNEKKISGEIDIIAIRFPYHIQDDTEHNSSEYLEIPATIDIVIGEVKSHGITLKFNKSLRNDNLVSLTKTLKWIGIFKQDQIEEIAQNFLDLIKPVENSQNTNFRTLLIHTEFGPVSLRPILFGPESISTRLMSDKFVGWREIDDFLWSCLCPSFIREECGTRYDFNAWGNELSDIVKVYKDRQAEQNRFANIKELYTAINLKQMHY